MDKSHFKQQKKTTRNTNVKICILRKWIILESFGNLQTIYIIIYCNTYIINYIDTYM